MWRVQYLELEVVFVVEVLHELEHLGALWVGVLPASRVSKNSVGVEDWNQVQSGGFV
jgi:hypothetical protein